MKFNYLLSMCLVLCVTQVKAAILEKLTPNFENQMLLAKNSQKPMSVRWQALVNSAEFAQYEQIAEIKKFTKSSDWFMRNAALVALQKIGINHVEEEARFLLKDKALVVRSAAVDVLANRYTIENRALLAEELNKSYNFNKKQSLWIRSKIFDLMASRASIDDKNFFTRYLFDSDPKIVNTAMLTLEKISNVKFTDDKNGKKDNRIDKWKDFVKTKGWL